MNLNNLDSILEKEPPYRQKQVMAFLFGNLIENWQEATSLPLELRAELDKKCPLLIKARIFRSKDENTAKALIALQDGLEIESVLIHYQGGRNTVCVSCQVGCALACKFCATGRMGFKRNLDSWEIVEQVLFFSRYLKGKEENVSNVVFMGMGEPFLNYDNVLEAVRILNDKDGFNIGARHISISTSGIIEGIKRLAKEKFQVNLAISLHAPDDKLRSEIMPINKKYPLKNILSAVDDYIKKTRRKVMFEYMMIKGLNDSDDYAKKLAGLMKKPLYFVNLITCNPTGIFKSSSSIRIKRFKRILEKQGVAVTERYRFGRDIEASCGQLVI